MFEVKIYKPDKSGNLKKTETISGDECSKIHWATIGGDPNRTYKVGLTGINCPRIGQAKECIEDGCTGIVEDGRHSTCSPECKRKRIRRQQRLSNSKNYVLPKEVECKQCKSKYIAKRKNNVFCSKKCRNKQAVIKAK